MSILTSRTWLNSFQRFLPLTQRIVLYRLVHGETYDGGTAIGVARKRPNTDEQIIAANLGYDSETCNWSLWNNGETDAAGNAYRPRVQDRIRETVDEDHISYDGSGALMIGDGGALLVEAGTYRYWKIVRVKETIYEQLYACTCVKEVDV